MMLYLITFMGVMLALLFVVVIGIVVNGDSGGPPPKNLKTA